MKAAAPLSVVAIMAASAVAITDFNPANSLGRLSPDNSLGRVHAARAHARRAAGGKQYKRCKAKSTGSEPAPTPAPAPASTPAPTPEPATSSKSYEGGSSGGSGGTINVQTSGCGDIGAVSETNKYAGPNGSEDWLTCGIKNGGWNPPFITVSDLKFKDLGAEFASGNSIFKPCAQYSDAIYSAANDYKIPAIMIASIMMQESSCNKDTVGGGGEQGLMQITHEKCGGAPNGDCKEPWYNIHTGAKYLSDQINNNGGNVLLALGSYNGWYKGLTYDKATAAAHTDCCRCQNNLDYPHQFLNGWMQGKDAYSSDLGTYKNLEVCF